MKTRLTSLTYLGYTVMDRRFSTAMLPWLLKEIATTGISEKLSVTIEDGYLKAYNGNFEPVLIHRLVDILRISQVPGRPDELFYIFLNEKEALLHCYLFKASTVHEASFAILIPCHSVTDDLSDQEDIERERRALVAKSNMLVRRFFRCTEPVKVTDLFVQMREPSPGLNPKGSNSSLPGSVTRNVGFQQNTDVPPWCSPSISLPNNCHSNLASETPPLVKSVSNASTLTSLNVDLSPSDSHFFEVLYIGKVRISQRKVPETLIDDALHKLAQHEIEKAKTHRRHSLLSSTGTSVYSQDSNESINDKKSDNIITFNKTTLLTSTTPLEPTKHISWKSDENLQTKPDLDKEFDLFTKERVEKNNNTPLIVSVPKKNLGTVTEDEEKTEEIHKNEPSTNVMRANPFKTELKIVEDKDVQIKQTIYNRTKELEKNDSKLERIKENISQINFDEISRKPGESKKGNVNEGRRFSMPENKPFLRDRAASIGTINIKTPIAHLLGEQNRTMLFQVGRSELRLISPDRKQILLHRAFKDVASCVVGRINKEHLGFVCRETNDTYACYVFKCESDSVATEVVSAIKQAFSAHAELIKKTREKSPNMTCEHCPLLWYHRLCHDIDGMNDKKTHAFILRRIEQLPEDEQELIITKYQGGTNHMYETSEHNSFLMMLLRAHCEAKQQRHVHDTAENRSEFLNQYLGGSTIFMKAKRSLSNSFDHLLKRKASRDDIGLNLNIKKETSPILQPSSEQPPSTPEDLLTPVEGRGKSLSPAVVSESSEPVASPMPYQRTESISEENEDGEEGTPVNSPMMEIFLKVSDSRQTQAEQGHETDATWRQAIYENVQPHDQNDNINPKNLLGVPTPQGKRTREQLRQLWKMAIEQTVLLIRMEKENNRLKESEESSAVRRIKLEYTELHPCSASASLLWESYLARQRSQPQGKLDHHMLAQAVIQGIPRVSRGAVWYFLAQQAGLRLPPPDLQQHPLYRAHYHALLANLTKHQHAILIDLGRTFPKHSYFASALGPGQLALYNILKAYSILDPEVGYCQGLSFVAGVLLLHLDESEAFYLLRHLMFRRGLRKQYLPDMSALQVQLYQLSRLLRDHEPELHAKLSSLEVSPCLYAAPWMLTLFTSQFPLGFIVTVFDLIFLDSLDVVFSVSLALLSVHKDGLMLCESCEEAAEYLKHKLPDVDKGVYDKVMKKVHSLDISRQLSDYAVEYAVLREEMPRVAALTEDNRRLAADNNKMSEELDSAMDAITNYQNTQAKYENQSKVMEQQLCLLTRFITSHNKSETPPEIKKILQMYTKKTTFGTKIFKFSTNEEEESDKKVFKTGTSAPNLFAKVSKDDVINAVNKEKNSPEKNDDRRHFMMRKSQSVHSGLIANNLKNFPLKVLDEKHERTDSFKSDGVLTESLKELGKRHSGFFANTHEQIRQERMFEQQLKHDFDENLKKLDERLAPKSYMSDVSLFQSRKTMSLNLIDHDSKLNDSGFVTPLSPNEKERKMESSPVTSHPLSDLDADIKFDGTTQLKQIRPLRNNSISLDTKQA